MVSETAARDIPPYPTQLSSTTSFMTSSARPFQIFKTARDTWNQVAQIWNLSLHISASLQRNELRFSYNLPQLRAGWVSQVWKIDVVPSEEYSIQTPSDTMSSSSPPCDLQPPKILMKWIENDVRSRKPSHHTNLVVNEDLQESMSFVVVVLVETNEDRIFMLIKRIWSSEDWFPTSLMMNTGVCSFLSFSDTRPRSINAETAATMDGSVRQWHTGKFVNQTSQ